MILFQYATSWADNFLNVKSGACKELVSLFLDDFFPALWLQVVPKKQTNKMHIKKGDCFSNFIRNKVNASGGDIFKICIVSNNIFTTIVCNSYYLKIKMYNIFTRL